MNAPVADNAVAAVAPLDAALDALQWLSIEERACNVSVVDGTAGSTWMLSPGLAHRSFVVAHLQDIGMVLAAYDLPSLRWFAFAPWERLAVAPDQGFVFLKCPAASGGAGTGISGTKPLLIGIPMNANLQERILQDGQCLIALTAPAQEGFCVTEEASLVPVTSHISTPEYATRRGNAS